MPLKNTGSIQEISIKYLHVFEDEPQKVFQMLICMHQHCASDHGRMFYCNPFVHVNGYLTVG